MSEQRRTRREFLKSAACSTAGLAALLYFPRQAMAGNYVVGQAYLNILSKAPNGGYLLWTDGKGLPQSREYKIKGQKSGTQVGESDQCVALVKAVAGAPQTSKWTRGRQVIKSNLARGTAIATFVNGKYSGHTCILAGLRSDGSIEAWSQNWVGTYVNRHTISKTNRGGVTDSAAYYEIIV